MKIVEFWMIYPFIGDIIEPRKIRKREANGVFGGKIKRRKSV
jgi:hypothetical protein